eukprot:3014268-Prymnesium_polylepis.1
MAGGTSSSHKGKTTDLTHKRAKHAEGDVYVYRNQINIGLALSRRPPGARTCLLRTPRSHEYLNATHGTVNKSTSFLPLCMNGSYVIVSAHSDAKVSVNVTP